MTPRLRDGETIFRFTNSTVPLLDNRDLICRSANDHLNSDDPLALLQNGPLECRFPNENDPFAKGEEIFSNLGNMVDKAATVGDSSTQWISVTIIACSITITAVVLRWFMKKKQKDAIIYSPIYTSSQRNQVSPVLDHHIAVNIPPFQPEVPFSQNQGETMERFIEDVARKKPKKFSAQEIKDFIGNPPFVLGSGGYGDVYRGIVKDGVMIAVKVLKDNQQDKIKEQFISELGTLGITHHVNLVRLLGFCFDPTMRALVYEYMENGSLDKLLFDKNKQVEWQKLHQIAIGVAKGLAYLHEYCQPEIIHYDIKPGNVLLDSELRPKVADFGLARLCNKEINSAESSQASNRKFVGTIGYAAPELSKQNIPVTNKCDVYSFGVLLLEIIWRRKNYMSAICIEKKEILSHWTWRLLEDSELTNIYSECGIKKENQQEAERMLMVVFLCIHNDPNKRPKMSSVVKMLEGEMEISRPLCPFDNFSAYKLSGSTSERNKKPNATMEMVKQK